MPDATPPMVNNDPIDEKQLISYFESAGFVVKVLEISGNICRMEWNYPDESRARALRWALGTARKSNEIPAEVTTRWEPDTNPHAKDSLSRERVLVPFENHADLRRYFNTVMDLYVSYFDSTGLNPQGKMSLPGAQPNSSYHITNSRVRRPLSAGER